MNFTDDLVSKMTSALENGSGSDQELADAARTIGKNRNLTGVPLLILLLNHRDSIVRYNAAKSLGYELHERGSTNYLIALLSDPDEDVRDIASGSLTILWQGTNNDNVLRALAKMALTDTDEELRDSAYRDFLIVQGVSLEEHRRLLLSGVTEISPEERQRVLSEYAR